MNIYLKKSYFFYSGALLFLILVSRANAATLFLLPKTGEFRMGQEFDVELKVNSEGQGFNAAQATLQFPKDLLEVKSVDYSPAASVFNFWLENPSFFNTDSKITFIGGATNGISGSAIPILKIKFSAKGVGDGAVTFSDAAITAADGSGSNILSAMEIAIFKVVPATVAVKSPVPEPAQIVRAPAPAVKLPVKSIIKVPLYPDSEKWYNVVSEFLVQWDLPADVSGVSTALNRDPSFAPTEQSEGLFESKMFERLADGIRYLHVRFENDLGWGPANHYRIAIDTAPPLPFKIESADGLKTGNPSPLLTFSTTDSVSGLAKYSVRVDNQDEVETAKGELQLSHLGPGAHKILARAVDKAGNAIEDSVDLEIIPLPAPIIGFTTKSLSHGEFIYAAGKADSGLSVDVILTDSKKQEVFRRETKIDAAGNWEILIKDPLPYGSYKLAFVARDQRGALSYPTDPQIVKVRAPAVISFGFIDLSWFGIFMIFLLAAIAGGSFAAWHYTSEREKRGAYKTIIGRDIEKLTAMLENDIKIMNDMRSASGTSDGKLHADLEVRLSKMQEKINNMKKYLPQEIEKME